MKVATKCPEIMLYGYHLPTVARVALELGSPATGELAGMMWRMSTLDSLPVEVARDFMLAAGYEPFKGYPLQQKAS
jgi:hypothetical protein